MPKLKTCKGARKRFRITRWGKVRAGRAGKSHLLTTKNRKRKRKLRSTRLLQGREAQRVRQILPYA